MVAYLWQWRGSRLENNLENIISKAELLEDLTAKRSQQGPNGFMTDLFAANMVLETSCLNKSGDEIVMKLRNPLQILVFRGDQQPYLLVFTVEKVHIPPNSFIFPML